MQKSFIIVLCSVLVCFGAYAEETEEKLNVFGYPEDSYVTTIEAEQVPQDEGLSEKMPDCQNQNLIKQLKQTILPYVQDDNKSILNRRRVDLILKNISNFDATNINNPKQPVDVAVADRLMELKINNRISAKDIKVCSSTNNTTGSPVYLLMYFVNDKLVVEVINFTSSENPQFIFEDKSE